MMATTCASAGPGSAVAATMAPSKSEAAGTEVSTGTTILAIPCEDGVVLGADSRTSTGSYVASRYSDKLVQLSDHIFTGRSGSAADTQILTDYVRYYLQQMSIETGQPPRVKTAAHLMQSISWNNKSRMMAAFTVGGWDPVDGASTYTVTLGGSSLRVPFAVSGSGSTYITGLIDSQFDRQPNMTTDEARTFIKKAISHAIARDGSSGGIIRTVVVKPDGNHRDTTPGNELPFGPTGF